jgi:hypothetical protein
MSIVKMTQLNERITVRYSFDVSNVSNTPSFDIPIDNVEPNQYYNESPVQEAITCSAMHTQRDQWLLQLPLRARKRKQDDRQRTADSDEP